MRILNGPRKYINLATAGTSCTYTHSQHTHAQLARIPHTLKYRQIIVQRFANNVCRCGGGGADDVDADIDDDTQ